ncbi:MAG: hypothetical protein HOJ16_08480 [Candidatus Peribacter sp.]|nr:hypothetical protein [Candidatus Peribacter sp.]
MHMLPNVTVVTWEHRRSLLNLLLGYEKKSLKTLLNQISSVMNNRGLGEDYMRVNKSLKCVYAGEEGYFPPEHRCWWPEIATWVALVSNIDVNLLIPRMTAQEEIDLKKIQLTLENFPEKGSRKHTQG